MRNTTEPHQKKGRELIKENLLMYISAGSRETAGQPPSMITDELDPNIQDAVKSYGLRGPEPGDDTSCSGDDTQDLRGGHRFLPEDYGTGPIVSGGRTDGDRVRGDARMGSIRRHDGGRPHDKDDDDRHQFPDHGQNSGVQYAHGLRPDSERPPSTGGDGA